MQVASRPRFAAGVALVGATLVVASTVSPVPDLHLPDIHVPALRTAEVELAAAALAATPLSYAQVIQQAVTNAQALLDTFRANPTPILSQVAKNQATTLQNLMTGLQATGGAISTALTTTVPPLLQAAFNDLASGNVGGAINNVLAAAVTTVFPVTGFIPTLSAALTQPLTNLVNAINAVQEGGILSPLSQAVVGLLGPVLSGAGAFGVAVDNVGSAIKAGDPQAVLNAIVNGPAVILDGVLNGGYGPDLSALAGFGGAGILVVAGGLLSGGLALTSTSPVITVQLAGTINALQALAQTFAKALAPPTVTAALKSSALAAPTALPAAAAKTVTLTTGSPAAATPAKTSTSAAPASDGKATETSTQAPKDAADSTADTTTDSTPKSGSTDASTVKKPTDKGTDVSTGNKTAPHTTAGTDAPKSGDAAGTATNHEAAGQNSGSSSAATSGGGEKAGAKASHTASPKHASK
jgi:hypothetical protein